MQLKIAQKAKSSHKEINLDVIDAIFKSKRDIYNKPLIIR